MFNKIKFFVPMFHILRQFSVQNQWSAPDPANKFRSGSTFNHKFDICLIVNPCTPPLAQLQNQEMTNFEGFYRHKGYQYSTVTPTLPPPPIENPPPSRFTWIYGGTVRENRHQQDEPVECFARLTRAKI